MYTVREHFTALVLIGVPPVTALMLVLSEATEIFRAASRSEQNLRETARLLGFDDLARESESKIRRKFELYAFIVEGAERLRDIPSARCLDSHLPKDRRPTKDEIDQAWAICCGQS